MAHSHLGKTFIHGRTIRIITLIAVCLSFYTIIQGCRIVRNRPPAVRDGKEYGVTPGAFRCRYWNYYNRGLSYAEGGFWEEAEDDFRNALVRRDCDRLRSRTYGMHFIEYLPHRELGTSLFHLQKYQESIQEL